MRRGEVKPKLLEEIRQKLVCLIEENQKEIIRIAEATEEEIAIIRRELEQLYEEVRRVIDKVDVLTVEERRARWRLAEVSADFSRYSEADIKEAYEHAQRLQVELLNLRAKEELLRARRDELERTLKRLLATKERAEKLASRVSVVLEYLRKDFQELADNWREMLSRQELALKVLEVQEEERRRVAREIHDGPAQVMANVVLRVEYCLKLMEKRPEALGEELRALQELVREGLQEVRKIIYDLRPMALDDLGLVAALRRYLEDFRAARGLETDFVLLGRERRLPATQEAAIFRIVQEALSNVAKHAAASRVLVKLEFGPRRLNLVVKDDGRGFVPEKVLGERRGFGLWSMKERAELLGGELGVFSNPGQGTVITLSVPLAGEEGESGANKGAGG
ncbi:sensor histidine kinase [Ammonifex thiophilus]|uniref:Oxygen sensor histidine kinase NreB n=1 Tax=Ammonifex thiophilus TaxID=444093 RepID=A0A3D8P4J8_9THEO|nr:sensor histidine kinase [Ammonifex thiophilus]RDV84069.1 histidine kinase [Ammonifex thiophilus]